MTPGRLLSLALTIVGLGIALPAEATALSQVTSSYGQMTFFGDDSAHDIQVYISSRDVEERTAPAVQPSAELLANASQAAGSWSETAVGVEAYEDRTSERVGNQLNGLQMEAAPLLAAAGTPEEFKQLVTKYLQRGGTLHTQLVNLDNARTARTAAFRAYDAAVRAGGSQVLAAQDNVAAAKRAYDAAAQAVKIAEANLAPLTAEIDAVLAHPPAGSSGYLLKKFRDGVAQLQERIAGARLRLLGAAALVVMLGSTAYSATQPVEQVVEPRVVVIDHGGQPIREMDDGCRHDLRTTDGEVLPNAVSCAVPAPFSVWSTLLTLLGGGELSLHPGINISSGDANDNIEVEIPPSAKLSYVNVYGGGGNDTISLNSRSDADPASFKWDSLISGGNGSDAISGGPQSDDIRGDRLTQLTSPIAPNNDRIVGRGGDDQIDGQWGHDLIVGGQGDDDLFAGEGRNVLVGGPGKDSFEGEDGDALIVARELWGSQAADPLIDCGEGSVRYAILGGASSSEEDVALNCDGEPPGSPTIDSLAQAIRSPVPPNGNWPWFG